EARREGGFAGSRQAEKGQEKDPPRAAQPSRDGRAREAVGRQGRGQEGRVSGPTDRRIVGPWRRLGAERVVRCRVFDVDRVRFAPPDDSESREFYVVEAPDWINVVPLTEDQRVVFVRQFRFGT